MRTKAGALGLPAGLRRIVLSALAATGLFALTGLPAVAFREGPQSIAPLAERLSDAVVNISTTQVAKSPDGVPLPKVPKGSPFEDFFEEFFNKRGGRAPQDRKVSSLGSGFVIDGTEGLIVTNNHVIEGADEIVVNFHDGTKLKVDKVLGRDTKADVALLKVTPKSPLKAVPFGSSANMKVGDWVMAIGNPFGLGGSVSLGIISAKQRDINAGAYDDFIQTDAAINRGNSGGPLFNMDGEVIGINTAIISPTGGSIGIGFAVPSDTVQTIVQQLREFGQVRRGWLGVKIQTVAEDIAESLGVQENTGALVSAVTPEGPAAKAGLAPGDVILKFDGKDVSTMRGLPRLVAQAPIGKAVDVELLRAGEKKTIKVVVGRLEEDDEEPADKVTEQQNEEPAEPSTVLGLTVTPLTEELRTQLGFEKKVSGLLVTGIDPDGPAAGKSVKLGDVIVEAQQEPIGTVDDLNAAIAKVKKAGGRQVLMLVEDAKGDTRFVTLPL
jgi:serine protease Do